MGVDGTSVTVIEKKEYEPEWAEFGMIGDYVGVGLSNHKIPCALTTASLEYAINTLRDCAFTPRTLRVSEETAKSGAQAMITLREILPETIEAMGILIDPRLSGEDWILTNQPYHLVRAEAYPGGHFDLSARAKEEDNAAGEEAANTAN